MIFLHHAAAGWPTWSEFAEIIGARFHFLPVNSMVRRILDPDIEQIKLSQLKIPRSLPLRDSARALNFEMKSICFR